MRTVHAGTRDLPIMGWVRASLRANGRSPRGGRRRARVRGQRRLYLEVARVAERFRRRSLRLMLGRVCGCATRVRAAGGARVEWPSHDGLSLRRAFQ